MQTAFLLQVTGLPFFEVPTLVLAGLLLLAGSSSSGPANSVLILYAPALSAAPAQRADDLGRTLVDAVTGTVSARDARRRRVPAAGVRAHLLGLVVPATLAVSIAATAQLWATLDTLPRWLALAWQVRH